jgi:hypothetical protein
MKKHVFLLGFILALISCSQPANNSNFTTTTLTYSVSGTDAFNIRYLDANGVEQKLTAPSVPWTLTIPGYTYSKPMIWAQNANTTDYYDPLTVKIISQKPSETTSETVAETSSTRLYCIATTSYQFYYQ